jgi:chitin synthase
MQTQSLTGDITLLPISSLTDHNITSHVASRFLQGMPYITISTGTLVALNTNEPVDINQELVFRDLAARIYNRLVKRGENQAAIFLGETGSGKTEFRDFLVSHLLSMNHPLHLPPPPTDFLIQKANYNLLSQPSPTTLCPPRSSMPTPFSRLSQLPNQ